MKRRITIEEFADIYRRTPGEPEFELYFDNRDGCYCIIKFADSVSFQRCGYGTGSGESFYPDLETLFTETLVDGICLREEWGRVRAIIAHGCYDLCDAEELQEYLKWFAE